MTIRGIDYLSHQYDFMKALKDDCQFDWLIQHRRGYNLLPRGDFIKELGVNEVTHYEKGKYDLAILHLDQQCLEESLWERGKGSLYKEVNEVIDDIPKIVIVHGTPFYPERFNDIELCGLFKKAIGDNYVVCNSQTARYQWAFGLGNTDLLKRRLKRGMTEEEAINGEPKIQECGIPLKQITTIIHGINPDDFQDLPKEPRVVTMISPGGLDAYYDRSFLQAVKDLLSEKNIGHCHISVDVRFHNFDEYSRFLGSSLVYFNPTRESCMPRARTEAMLSGCCVVTTPSQDADTFIKHSENGYLIPRSPQKVVDLIEGLVLEYKTAIKVGQAGKETALKLFTYDRYRQDWLNLINKVLGK